MKVMSNKSLLGKNTKTKLAIYAPKALRYNDEGFSPRDEYRSMGVIIR
jgi:hypothetical protein